MKHIRSATQVQPAQGFVFPAIFPSRCDLIGGEDCPDPDTGQDFMIGLFPRGPLVGKIVLQSIE